jgi:hypothetical protein
MPNIIIESIDEAADTVNGDIDIPLVKLSVRPSCPRLSPGDDTEDDDPTRDIPPRALSTIKWAGVSGRSKRSSES